MHLTFEDAFSLRYPTFTRVYKSRWADILKFRQRSMLLDFSFSLGMTKYIVRGQPVISCHPVTNSVRFTECKPCWHFKDGIANALTMEEKLGMLLEYRQHLASQYADRSICWMLQQLPVDPMSDCVVMQIDGMDQGKFRFPRDPKLRASASLASFERPILKLHGLWIFGASARFLCLHFLDFNRSK